MPRNIAGPSKKRRLSGATGLLAAALLTAAPSGAVSDKEAASFLDVPVGGRPAALGGAYSSLASDGYAPLWNPGGLAFARRTQLAATHLANWDASSYEHASVSQELKGGHGLGASFQTWNGSFSAYSLAYGRRVTPKAGLGLAVKLLDSVDGRRVYRADLGALYAMDERTSVSAVVANGGARAGATYWPFPKKMSFSLEGVKTGETTGVRSGVEGIFLGFFSVRAGFDTTLASSRRTSLAGGLTMGAGFKFAGQDFDYAWVPRGDLGSTSQFSLHVRFGLDPVPPAAAPVAAPPAPQQEPARRDTPTTEDYEESETPPSPPMIWLQN